MPTYTVIAASPAVGSNILDDETWSKVKNTCRIVAMGVTGGTLHALHIEVYYGQEKIADLYNNAAANSPGHADNRHWISSNKRCVRGDSINVEVVAAGAETYYLWFDIKEG